MNNTPYELLRIGQVLFQSSYRKERAPFAIGFSVHKSTNGAFGVVTIPSNVPRYDQLSEDELLWTFEVGGVIRHSEFTHNFIELVLYTGEGLSSSEPNIVKIIENISNRTIYLARKVFNYLYIEPNHNQLSFPFMEDQNDF